MLFNPFRLKKKKLHPFFWVFACLVGVAALWILRPYLSMALLAFVVATLFEGFYDRLEKWVGGRKSIASLLGVFSLIGMFILLATLLLNVVIRQVVDFSADLSVLALRGDYSLDELIGSVNSWMQQLPWEVPIVDQKAVIKLVQDSAGTMGSLALNNAVSIGSSSLTIALQVFIFSVFLYIFLPSVQELKKVLFGLSPLEDDVDTLYYSRVLAVLQSLLKGTFVVTLAQSLLGSVFLMIAGVEYVGFWLALMLMIGIVPGGVGLVLVPIGIALLIWGHLWQGIVVILGSLFVVGTIDNLLRPLLISKEVELRPVWVLLGIIGGIQTFGLIGILYGPVVMVLLKTTIEVALGRRS